MKILNRNIFFFFLFFPHSFIIWFQVSLLILYCFSHFGLSVLLFLSSFEKSGMNWMTCRLCIVGELTGCFMERPRKIDFKENFGNSGILLCKDVKNAFLRLLARLQRWIKGGWGRRKGGDGWSLGLGLIQDGGYVLAGAAALEDGVIKGEEISLARCIESWDWH